MPNDKVDFVFRLNDKPKPTSALLAVFQHLLAMSVGLITPTIIIAGVSARKRNSLSDKFGSDNFGNSYFLTIFINTIPLFFQKITLS
ncbi:MAG: hypothetical protein PWQ09_186 [Candidatus Cloacimonadota bacterium]|jgi:hypothetical protein|nr:hypothetical protein [Candidatus Cloacimonadota bacterium]